MVCSRLINEGTQLGGSPVDFSLLLHGDFCSAYTETNWCDGKGVTVECIFTMYVSS